MDPISQLALDTLKINKQALIFLPSRASAEKTAEDIAKLTSFQLPDLEQKILHAGSTPTKQCRRLSTCIRKGIAFHHAGLLSQQRELIENEFRSGTIKIICCTPTLAAGLSMPAFRVIIKSLKRYSGQWGMDWIPVLEYLQMAGRAGRPEYEKWGEAITIAKDAAEKDEIYERYICGVPEDIYSKLAAEPVLRTYLLSLISSGIIRDDQTLYDFFSKTFWAHQYEDLAKLNQIIQKMLSLLTDWKFITISGKNEMSVDFVSAACVPVVGKEKNRQMQATLLGKRVAELYLDPLTARHLLDTLADAADKPTFSFLQVISHTLEMRPLLRIKVKEEEWIQQELVKRYDQLLEPEPSVFNLEYDEFMLSLKTALFFEEWIDEKDEDYLLEKYDIRPGEIRVKLDVADWLLYAAQELSSIAGFQIATELRKLRVRVQHGVKEELLVLLKFKGIGRVRARRLYVHGIKSIGDVKNVDLTTLSQILGKALAEDLKKQVGQEIDAIPEGRRKGQLSVQKFG